MVKLKNEIYYSVFTLNISDKVLKLSKLFRLVVVLQYGRSLGKSRINTHSHDSKLGNKSDTIGGWHQVVNNLIGDGISLAFANLTADSWR